LHFFLNVILDQSKRAVKLLSKEQTEKLLSPQQEAVWKFIEKKQEVSPLEISKSTDVARPTVNQALNKLLKLKKIERIGSGRATRYRKL
jgi:predicted HTH transcriptional regulator